MSSHRLHKNFELSLTLPKPKREMMAKRRKGLICYINSYRKA